MIAPHAFVDTPIIVDVGVYDCDLPRAECHAYLRRLAQSGFSDWTRLRLKR